MGKQIVFNDNARQHLLKGIDIVSNAVKVTLGPKGRTVMIDRNHGAPYVTKDGVTVAKEIYVDDKLVNMGISLIKEVAGRTADGAGDGTTTSTVLAQAIAQAGLKYVSFGANPMDLKRGLDAGVKEIIKNLREMATPVTNKEEITQVGAISANNDNEIGKLIADAMDKVGNDGIITIEEARGFDTYLTTVDGMQFDNGYMSPYFVTNTNSMSSELDSPLILIHKGRINNLKKLVKTLELVSQTGRPLVIISDDIEQEVLATLVMNHMRGGLKCVAVKSPGFGDNRKDLLEDIAILTGGIVISDEGATMKLEDIHDVSPLGSCKKITITTESTTIIEGSGDEAKLGIRVNMLRSRLQSDMGDYERDKLQERLAKLAGGVAVINIGATTETELKEKKDRVEDALHATRAAVQEGIVPGGGIALIRASTHLDEVDTENDDQKMGLLILLDAVKEPLRAIVSNAGIDGSVIINKVRENDDDYAFGFNAYTEKYANLVEDGVIDPVKVTRTALENAVSIASIILTTECIITDIPKDESKVGMVPPSPSPFGGMI